MARYIDDCAAVALKVIPQLANVPPQENTSLCLLPEEAFTRYSAPLGDG